MKKILSLVLALCMLVCMAGFAAADEVPTLKMITLGNGMPDNYDAWIEKLNAYVEEKIGARLDVECIGWGDWGNRRSVIINSNEPYDIIFGDIGNLRQDVAIGAYLPLTDELLKSQDAAENLRRQIKSYLDEISDLKRQLFKAQNQQGHQQNRK